MLELKNISKRFNDTLAVDNLSFEVKKGEIVGLIGENGSGKTTTIKMIAGLYEPSFGQIIVAGQDVNRRQEQARAMIGYIPDEPAVYDKLTGEEFLHFIAEAFVMNKEQAQKKIAKLQELYPMPAQTNGTFSDFSRGTRQKYMIMAALMHEPPLLLVDEPIVGLDPKSAETTINLFKDYVKDSNRSILLCTHTLTAAEKLCNRFVVLKLGKMLASGTLDELRALAKTSGTLEDVYLKLMEQGEKNENI